ncbi:MAG: dicarboxylate/amino acid:cation symporter [Planctomycetota bacterium]|nr:dicarboxylate/amino acid:cation symporter [Planctomycetota bacterium]
MAEKKKSHLTLYIGAAIVLAVAVALLFPHFAMKLHIGGEIFLRLLKMMVVPLVMSSVMSGIIGLGDIRKLGRPGGYAVLYYLTTTVVAVAIGLIVVNIIQPGIGTVDKETLEKYAPESEPTSETDESPEIGTVDKETLEKVAPESEPTSETEESLGVGTILKNLALMLFTDNLISSAAMGNLLPLIVFSLVFAGMLTTMGEKVKALTQMITQINDAFMSFILLLMKVAPLGIFCLVAARFGEAQAEGKIGEVLRQTGWYSLSVLVGLAIHAFGVLPLIFWILTRKNPYRFMIQMSEALLTAFSTASSSATLPVTMKCASLKGGVSKRSTDLVLPLGATVNMDGTALYEAVAAIFIAQAIGRDLSMMDQLVVAVTATLAAIGAAGIPEAGLVTMIIVLNAVGLPIEYIGLILSVDWLLDRFRTAVNVFGDTVGAAVVDKAFDP